jgi:hypothetical protein
MNNADLWGSRRSNTLRRHLRITGGLGVVYLDHWASSGGLVRFPT